MRWAIIGAYNEDSVEFHLVDSLRFLGHEACVFDLSFGGSKGTTIHYWLRRAYPKYDQSKAKRLADQILDYKPDVVIGVYRYIHPSTIDIIKKRSPSTVVIHINPDQLTTLEQQQIIASSYDHYFTKDPFMFRFMRDMAGLNAHYLPEAFNPRLHVPPPETDREKLEDTEDTDVLLFGSMYPYRTRIIEQMVKAGFKVKIYGNQSKYLSTTITPFFQNKLIHGQDKSYKIVSARIVLNCFHYAEVDSVNVKYFEINGIGGFQLCDYKSTLSEYSPVKPELYAYHSTPEAIELIKYYLPRQAERYAIALQQRDYFLNHHTYEHRIREVLKIIF